MRIIIIIIIIVITIIIIIIIIIIIVTITIIIKPECLAHVLARCRVLAQTKYFSRHNAALKIAFFEMLKDMDLIESSLQWYSPLQPKPVYQNERAEAYWDVPVYAESTVVKSNKARGECAAGSVRTFPCRDTVAAYPAV